MQLRPVKKSKNIKLALATATTALLTGITPSPAQADAKWTGSFSSLYYSETDRVTAIEPVFTLDAEYSGDRHWTNKLVIDTLTGNSHNGAVASRNPQTFTTPSGSSTYIVGANQPTLDPSFKDTRFALSSQWSQPLGASYEVSGGINGSKEYDFTSLSGNASISRYFDVKNTKLSLGINYELDSVAPVGGVPQGLSTMGSKVVLSSTESKNVADLLLGLTQVMNRRWIVQLNYNLGMSNGYMNDPYKIVSEVVATGGAAGDPTGTYYYDKRPDTRVKNAVFLDSKVHMDSWGILGTSYRYFFDDWGITSHTFNVDWRFQLSPKWYIEPGLRYYVQNKADFYRYFTVQGVALPQHMSADYRLGDMTATSFGLEAGRKLSGYGKEISFRAQLYTQTGDSHPGEAYGNLLNQDLSPKVTAVMGILIYKF
jgi:hypothetical protein